MRITVAARRYAKALSGMITTPALLEKTAGELASFQSLMADNESLRAVLLNPALVPSARKDICTALAGKLALSVPVRNFLCLLIDRGRLAAFPQIVEAFRELVDIEAGTVRVEVRSSIPLSKKEEEEVRKILGKTVGKNIIITMEDDPSLLGGIVARIGSQVYDFSLKTQLERLRESIAKGG